MLQGTLFEPESSWKPPTWEELPSWANAQRVAVDIETYNPDIRKLGTAVRRGGFICGVSFAIEDGPSHYLPTRHLGGGNMDERGVREYLKEQCKVFKGEIVGANLGYDLDFLLEQQIEFKLAKYFRDIQIADPLLYELHMRYSLDHIAERHGVPGKDETMLREAAATYGVDPKADLWKLPAKFVGAYAEGDVLAPLRILRKQEKLIDEADLWKIYNMESKLLPVLVRMKRRGVLIDQDKLQQVEDYSVKEGQKALDLVKDATGHEINIRDVMNVGAIKPALTYLGLTLPKTGKSKKDSITADWLKDLKHPVADAIIRARKVGKLKTTFANSVREHMVNGRIHCDLKQIAMEDDKNDKDEKIEGGRYGRLSCVKPNLQQQPSRDEFASFWRSIYVPNDGGLWACKDYSQQEPRWTTHFAAVLDLPMAQIAAQKYWDDPNMDSHNMMAELTGLSRTYAKDIFLGLCYGKGGASLCHELGLPTRWAVKVGRNLVHFETKQEALNYKLGHERAYIWEAAGLQGQSILDEFNKRVPFVKELAKRAESKAKRVGKVKTVGGRVLNFEQKADGSFDFAYKALNRVIQGSSADQVKMAMIELDAQGYYLQLQVHDEVDSTVQSVEEAHRMGVVMSEIVEAKVPFKVDVEVGKSWGEIRLTEIIDGNVMDVELDKKTKKKIITPWVDWRNVA